MPTQHTPAPWQSHPHPTHAAVITTATGHPIALILDQGSDEATDAPARLIAAAPELLAALQALLPLVPEKMIGTGPFYRAACCAENTARDQARSALAKAIPES